ncbi:hypothetical protein [Thermoleptolyngbya sp. M55_K2018_002]|uniref:hypothetical protein n=1 Tax=Thermoleptolyngbya sp. M55_K2018_002 TaxID=2747808 RepID=UPI0019DBFAD5|nr:hypothetical protein [Thermoleptolyngbya sp. M55_K2018_002]HIK40666.1 hypothetical protein [Thermoleptolyngbya sp. M55_K2018_002]
MNLKSIALSLVLGLSTPLLAAELLTPQAAIAQTFPTGDYASDRWFISIWFEGGSLQYQGIDRSNQATLRLAGAAVSGDSSRRVYTWRNGDYRYQVSWRPSDPGFIRLQVFHPNGRELVNSLLQEIPQSP